MKKYICLACCGKVSLHSESHDYWCPACGAMHFSIGLGEWRVARPTNQIFRDIVSDPPPPARILEVEYVCRDTGIRGFGLTDCESGKMYDGLKVIEYGSWRPINPGDPEEKKNEL